MRRLGDGAVLPLEDARQEVHLEHDVFDSVDRDAVADVVRVLDEQEDDRRQDLLHRRADEPRQTEDEGAGTGSEASGVSLLQSGFERGKVLTSQSSC